MVRIRRIPCRFDHQKQLEPTLKPNALRNLKDGVVLARSFGLPFLG
jgi:hypothetical protein